MKKKFIKTVDEFINENSNNDILEYASWMPPTMEKELKELVKRDDEIGGVSKNNTTIKRSNW